jgi:hypothetical protein
MRTEAGNMTNNHEKSGQTALNIDQFINIERLMDIVAGNSDGLFSKTVQAILQERKKIP